MFVNALVKGAEPDSVGQGAGSPTHQAVKSKHRAQKLSEPQLLLSNGEAMLVATRVFLKGRG